MKQIVLTVAVTAPRSSLTAAVIRNPATAAPIVPSDGGDRAR
jgi:hypothetical protein